MNLDPHEQRRLERSLEIARATLLRLQTASHRKSRWRVGATLMDEAATLVALGRFEEGLGPCNEVIRHFGASADTPTQVLVAAALRYKRVALGELGRVAEARAVCDEVIRRFSDATEEVLREEVAAARAERPELTIRGPREDELDAIAALTLRAFEEYGHLVSPEFSARHTADVADVRRRWEAGEVIVAEVGGSLLGTVTFYADGTRYPMPGWPAEWSVVRLLAVDPAGRGLGIGRQLLDACVHRARGAGCQVLGLHTAPFMRSARRIYEAAGFTRAPDYDVESPGAPRAEAYRLTL